MSGMKVRPTPLGGTGLDMLSQQTYASYVINILCLDLKSARRVQTIHWTPRRLRVNLQSFTGPWNTLLDETKRFPELNFSSIPSEFSLLSLYICLLLYCRKAKLKVESISQYPCGNAKMGQRWNFCWAVREKSSENFQIFLILSLWE